MRSITARITGYFIQLLLQFRNSNDSNEPVQALLIIVGAIKMLRVIVLASHSLSSEFRSAYQYVDLQSISHIVGPVDLNHIFILFMRIVIRFVQTEN